VGPRADLDAVEKREFSCPCRESNTGCPVRSLVALPAELTPLPMYRVLSLMRQALAQSVRYYACQLLPVCQLSATSLQQPRFEPYISQIDTSLEPHRYSKFLSSVVMKATIFIFYFERCDNAQMAHELQPVHESLISRISAQPCRHRNSIGRQSRQCCPSRNGIGRQSRVDQELCQLYVHFPAPFCHTWWHVRVF
jgi:hypothetical protein